MENTNKTKEMLIETAIELFNEKGIKFTMDDLAKSVGMSKKTIYQMFRDKDTLVIEAVEYGFRKIKLDENEREENGKKKEGNGS